jgi:serine/alanine adding enzyme
VVSVAAESPARLGTNRRPTSEAHASSADPVMVRQDAGAERWNAFVAQHPNGTVEHLWDWKDVYARAFSHDTVYLSAERQGAIVGVLPLVRYRSALFGRFVVSLPYFNYAGLLANDRLAGDALMAAATDLARAHGARHLELRHTDRQFPALPARQNKLGFARPLPPTSDELWTSVDRKVRNQVRKAQKEGLTSAVGGVALVPEFYEVFAPNMRDLGTPVFPRALFLETLRAFPSNSQVFVVRRGEDPIAAGIALTFRDTVLVPWASSLRAFRHLCPNMLLYWQMLEWATGRGLTTFDFGRSSVGAGTQQFKEQWGAVGRPLWTEYVLFEGTEPPDQGTGNPRMRAAISAWTRCPLPIANWLGPRLMRHLA